MIRRHTSLPNQGKMTRDMLSHSSPESLHVGQQIAVLNWLGREGEREGEEGEEGREAGKGGG